MDRHEHLAMIARHEQSSELTLDELRALERARRAQHKQAATLASAAGTLTGVITLLEAAGETPMESSVAAELVRQHTALTRRRLDAERRTTRLEELEYLAHHRQLTADLVEEIRHVTQP